MAIFPGERVRGKHRPLITALIIAINSIVYVYTSLASGMPLYVSATESVLEYGFKPVYIYTDPLEALVKAFSAMFIHADLFHIFFNMYFLWIFGTRLEGFIGSRKMLTLYFISGLSAVLFHTAFIPIGGYEALTTPAVGASGAISGILGAYLLLFPYTKLVMCTFYLLIPLCFSLPASAFLLIWFAEQVLYGYLRLGGVAYFAHIGGFVVGLALTPLLARGLTRGPRHLDYLYRYFSDVYGIKITRPRGIGPGTKLALSILLVAVAGGFLYGAYATHNYSGPQLYALDLNVSAGDITQRDQVLLSVYESGGAIVSQYVFSAGYPYSYARIFLNRALPVLYNPSYSNATIAGEYLQYSVRISGVPVKVRLYIAKAQYDSQGVALYVEGSMETSVVQVGEGVARIMGDVKLDFATRAIAINVPILSALSIMSLAICILGISAVVRGEELAAVSQFEEPGVFPYV